MRHRALPVAVALAMTIAACGGEAASTTTTTQLPTSTTTAPTTTTEATTTTTVASTTTTSPETTQPEAADTWAVVLVAPDDVLNVRDEPLGEIVSTLDPTATGVTTTGSTDTLDDGALWREVETDGETGWVNSRFLAEEIDDDTFASTAPEALTYALTSWAQNGSGADWESVVGPKGFNVIHFDAIKTWPPSQNPFLDQTVYDWGGEATGPGQPVASDTFANQVGASFAGVVGDQDLQTATNQPLQGPEAAPPFIPTQFQNFDYIAFHDPGDDPSVDGLDWTTWYVYFDWTGSSWVLVGMSLDAWAP